MADFVAVIRRAVDGLSDNTPEMRVKVYEKARGAVLRQLESMKPRPPEEMLRRQLDKLEAAILEVEAEHAEALPEPDAIEAEPEAVPAPIAEEPAAPVPAEEPVSPPAAAETWSEPGEAAPYADEAVPHGEAVEPVHPAHSAWEQPEPASTPADQTAFEPAVEPEPPIRPVVPSARSTPLLWEDESWEGEEEQQAAPHQAEETPVEPQAYQPPEPAPKPEPEQAYHPEPLPAAPEAAAVHDVEYDVVHEDVHTEPEQPVHPAEVPAAEDYWQAAEEQEVPADFPIEEPTAHYGRTLPVEEPVEAEAVAEPQAAGTAWPEDGLSAPVTARVARERWTGAAVYQPGAEESIAEAAPALVAAYEESAPEAPASADPLGWEQAETGPLDVEAEPAEFVEVATVQGELAAAAQDSFDDPVLHAQASYEPIPERIEPLPEAFDAPAGDIEPVSADADPYHAAAAVPAAEAPRPAPQDEMEWDDSPFSDVPLPAGADARREAGQTDGEAWDDEFRDFAGYDNRGEPAADDLGDVNLLTTTPEKPARSYRIQPRRRMDFTSLGLGLLGLALVAGSGYGAWTFRDTLSGLVTGLVSTPPAEAPKPSASETPAKPAESGAATGTDTGTGTAATAPATPTDLASAEPDIQKFTQRLQPDGTEVDEGTASGSAAGEGRSLAPQTVASSEPAGTAPAPASGTAPAANAPAIPTGVSQKMYLYEERVGQTSPVAVEGAVVWSLKHEKTEDGKEEAIVQAQVNAPDRGLSALISFKRNLDPSLPASHLVELVFSLPKEFEGGAIESVQRVALKQTEQDRGDPLIAVPAKITDDFHMIALNDYADAREFNLKLLQTRDWIDIPVTYRNGRRALITMEKGATGREAFNQAIGEWRALDPSTTAVPANAPPPAPAPAPAPANPQ